VNVVSLVPSATETLLAWGIAPVACTRFCEQPAIAHVGGTKDPDVDAIVALGPDLVVVDEEENRREDAAALRAAGLEVFAFAVRSVPDVVEQCARLAALVGADAGPPWEPPPIVDPGATAFVPIWKRPWMGLGADTYGSDVLARLGWANALAGRPGRYPEVDLTEVGADAVLAPSEPYPFGERHVEALSVVAPVVLVDGRDLFWWGARTPAALARLPTPSGVPGST
jgi:ABC-type Fe3+-hydroxamate transport system substrate-binding protein